MGSSLLRPLPYPVLGFPLCDPLRMAATPPARHPSSHSAAILLTCGCEPSAPHPPTHPNLQPSVLLECPLPPSSSPNTLLIHLASLQIPPTPRHPPCTPSQKSQPLTLRFEHSNYASALGTSASSCDGHLNPGLGQRTETWAQNQTPVV